MSHRIHPPPGGDEVRASADQVCGEVIRQTHFVADAERWTRDGKTPIGTGAEQCRKLISGRRDLSVERREIRSASGKVRLGRLALDLRIETRRDSPCGDAINVFPARYLGGRDIAQR